MQTIVVILVALVREIVLSRATLQVENIALRQQVAVLKRERLRPWLRPLDCVFWVFLSRLWPRWKDALVIVKPETVIGWHRQGFRLFWKWKSCHGKPRVVFLDHRPALRQTHSPDLRDKKSRSKVIRPSRS